MADEAENKEQEKPADASGWQIVRFDAIKNPPVWLAASIYVLAALFALAVLVLVGFGLFASFHVAYETAVGDFKDRIEAAKVFFPILLALVGGPLLIWRVVTAHWQAVAARHQVKLARDEAYTSLFTKAVEQLGTTREETGEDGKTITRANLEVRLGAIYALERIAQDSERDHWPIIDVLCAYVRNPQNCGPPLKPPDNSRPGSSEYNKWLGSLQPHEDIHAALYAIGRRQPLDMKFDRSLNLAKTSLQDAMLGSFNFERANWRRANLESILFSNTNLKRALFIEANLSGIMFDNADLSGAFFSEAHIGHAFFDNAILNGAWFNRARLSNFYCRAAKLNGAVFDDAHFFTGSFAGADLADASLNRIYFSDADFANANLSGATLFGSVLSHTMGLTFEQLSFAIGDKSTVLPDSLSRPVAWPDYVLPWEEQELWIKKARAELANKT